MSSYRIRKLRKPAHPVLTLGNTIEGVFGVFTAISLVWTAITYGWSVALFLSICYVVAVAIVAFMSAYHLA